MTFDIQQEYSDFHVETVDVTEMWPLVEHSYYKSSGPELLLSIFVAFTYASLPTQMLAEKLYPFPADVTRWYTFSTGSR